MSTSTHFPDVLTNEDQYGVDVDTVVSVCDLTQEEKETWIAEARAGSVQARNALISHLLLRVRCFARRYAATYRWASHRIEYLDLVQEANIAMLVCLDRALETDNPYAYLTTTAYSAIRLYSRRCSSLIATPLTHDSEPVEVVSYDRPFAEIAEGTLLDLLSEAPQETRSPSSEDDMAPIVEAVQTLPERQRMVIVQVYGFDGHGSTAPKEIQREHGWNVNGIKRSALFRLYHVLAPVYPHYAQGDAVPVDLQAQRRRLTVDASVTPEQEDRLERARLVLEQRGQNLTADALRKEARVAAHAAKSYLNQWRARQGREVKPLAKRLEETYRQLEARGEKITVDKLKELTKTNATDAGAFLHRKRGTQPRAMHETPVQERLTQAYERMQARGEKITVKGLQYEAHCDSALAGRYLSERLPRLSVAERLARAYEQLQQEGQRITIRRLAQCAQAGEHSAQEYLAYVGSVREQRIS